jgi:cell division protein FtsL
LDDAVGWVVVAAAGLLIVSLVLQRLRIRKVLGLFERVFYFSMICWFLVTGIELILLAR